MPTFTKPEEVYDYFFQDTLEDIEGSAYVYLRLLHYMYWYIKKWRLSVTFWFRMEKQDVMTFNNLTPKWWSFTKTYLFLFYLFNQLKIQDDVEVIFHKKSYLQFNHKENLDFIELLENELSKNKGKWFFSNFSNTEAWDGILEFIEIKNSFDTDENIKIIHWLLGELIDDFQNGDIPKNFNLLSIEKQRSTAINKISDYYNLVWDFFTIKESIFGKEKISTLFVVILLWNLWYIHIRDFHSLDDEPVFDEKGKYLHEKENLNFDIQVTTKAKELFEWLFEIKNIILNKIFDEEYKKISILRKGWKFHMIEWEKEINGDEALFVELQKKYPHSDIKAKNYKGKATKYEVKEKIKLNNIEQE